MCMQIVRRLVVRRLVVGWSLLLCLLGANPSRACASPDERVVRIAELEIAPDHLEAYKAALKEEINESIHTEPGVLTLYAVSVKGHPEQIRLFEIYADAAAYQAHLRSPHFMKYKARTGGMVRFLRLVETDAVLLGSK